MNDKLFFCDVETGGLDPKNNPILQLSGMIEVNSKTVEEFNWFVAPTKYDRIDPASLAANGLDENEIANPNGRFQPPAEVFRSLTLMLSKYVNKFNKRDKFQFVGYNSHAFDTVFVREWFLKHGDKYYGSWFFHPSIDVMLIAAHRLMNQRCEMENFKLATVAAQFGLTVDATKLHDSNYDVFLTRELYRLLCNSH